MKIGDLKLQSNVLLAPLAGVTDVGFRTIAREFGCALSYTEMVSAKGLKYGSSNTHSLLAVGENEKPCAVQIFGSDPEIMAEIIRSTLGKFDLIDINMGCPMPKIVKNGEGSALMKDLPKAAKVISACVKAASVPVTVKFRKGWDDEHINAVEFAKMCESEGASAVTVHGRTRAQMYEGRSDREIIARVKSEVRIPVIGNGDVFSPEDVFAMLSETGCDGVMIARGALGRPWIFKELDDPSFVPDRLDVIKRHFAMLEVATGEHFALVNMRKHIAWYIKGIRGASRLKADLCTMARKEDVFAALEEIL